MLAKGERPAGWPGYRSGYGARPRAGHWPDSRCRTLITRVGKLELRIPQDRDGRFSTELFEHYQRSERTLVVMYVQGVSTRKCLPSGLTRGWR